MRHHYIPQWLLRNFRDSNGKIYGFVKSNRAGGVFATTPKQLMVEKHRYTLLGESGPERQAAEKEYSGREALTKPIADKIISAARNNAQPRLTFRERLLFHYFHCDTWRRTPDIAAEKDAALGPFDKDAFLEWCRKEQHLDAGAGFRVPYELLTRDLFQVNYSSIRAGLVEFRRMIDAVQWQLFIPIFCAPVCRWFAQTAWAAGHIPEPAVRVEWSPPALEAVDSQKDAMADLLLETRPGAIPASGCLPQPCALLHGIAFRQLADVRINRR